MTRARIGSPASGHGDTRARLYDALLQQGRGDDLRLLKVQMDRVADGMCATCFVAVGRFALAAARATA